MSEDLTCKFCNRKFKNNNTLNVHIKTKCIKNTEKKENKKKESNFKCEYCNKNLSSNQMLKYHTQICFAQHKKTNKEDIDKISELKNEFDTHIGTVYNTVGHNLSLLKNEYSTYFFSLRNEFNMNILDLKNNEIKKLQEEIEELKKLRDEIQNFKNLNQEIKKEIPETK